MINMTRLFKVSYSNVYRANSEDEARELLQQDIDTASADDANFAPLDSNDWECEEIIRDDTTEWLFDAFENDDMRDD